MSKRVRLFLWHKVSSFILLFHGVGELFLHFYAMIVCYFRFANSAWQINITGCFSKENIVYLCLPTMNGLKNKYYV